MTQKGGKKSVEYDERRWRMGRYLTLSGTSITLTAPENLDYCMAIAAGVGWFQKLAAKLTPGHELGLRVWC